MATQTDPFEWQSEDELPADLTQGPLPDSASTPNITPTTTTTPTTQDTASPWATAPADGNWQAWFLKNIQGTPASPEALAKLEPFLKVHGIQLVRNAAGKAGKIRLPDGKVWDVGKAFSTGDPSQMAWQWIDADGGDAGGDWFDTNLGAPEAYQTLARPDYLQGEYQPPTWDEQFQAPDAAALYNDPSYQGRLDASRKAFERGAAAKGSILSGGSQIALGREQQNLASQEYGQVFGRAYDTYKQRYGQFQDRMAAGFGARGLNESTYQNDVQNNANQYGKRYQSWRDAIDDQFRLGTFGLNATTAGAP